MFLDNRHKVNIIHALIVGQTGSGKSYCIYNLILQMLVKETPYELYLVDPKFSGVYALGYKINKCNVSSNIDDTILLLKNFEAKMEERKKEYAEKLLVNLSHCFVVALLCKNNLFVYPLGLHSRLLHQQNPWFSCHTSPKTPEMHYIHQLSKKLVSN